jgi:hypothetical protein
MRGRSYQKPHTKLSIIHNVDTPSLLPGLRYAELTNPGAFLIQLI